MKIIKDIALVATGFAVGAAMTPQIHRQVRCCQKSMAGPWKKAKRHSRKFHRVAMKAIRNFNV